MTTVTTIEKLGQHVSETVELRGWIHNKSSKGKLHFVQLRDGTGFALCVLFKNDVPEELFDAVGHAGQESSIILEGVVKAEPRAPGGYEIGVKGGRVLQKVEGYPITPKEHGPDFLLSNRHLWLRSKRQWAVMRIRDCVITSIRRFYEENGFTCVDSPIFTPAACEGTSTLFEVSYFDDEKAYLTQSGQLYAEASAMALGKVYCFGPTFRAEKSKTRRHLTEFWMIEPEMAWCDQAQNMDVQEALVRYLVERVLERRQEELKVLERDTSKLDCVAQPFVRLDYGDAVQLAQRLGSDVQWGEDLGAPDEALIVGEHERPVFVMNYPKEAKAFYMKENPADPRTVLCSDLLAPEGRGEIIGGSQREDDYDKLLARIQEEGLPVESYDWYLALRKYGTFVHSGFGLGLERTVAWIAGIEHIREVIPFPRMMDRLRP